MSGMLGHKFCQIINIFAYVTHPFLSTEVKAHLLKVGRIMQTFGRKERMTFIRRSVLLY